MLHDSALARQCLIDDADKYSTSWFQRQDLATPDTLNIAIRCIATTFCHCAAGHSKSLPPNESPVRYNCTPQIFRERYRPVYRAYCCRARKPNNRPSQLFSRNNARSKHRVPNRVASQPNEIDLQRSYHTQNSSATQRLLRGAHRQLYCSPAALSMLRLARDISLGATNKMLLGMSSVFTGFSIACPDTAAVQQWCVRV